MAIKLAGPAPTTPAEVVSKAYVDGLLSLITSVFGDQAARSSDQALTTTNTWYDGPSVSLTAGTYVVLCQMQHWRTATTAETIFGRITNGSTHYSSAQFYHASVAGAGGQLVLIAKITLASTTTIKGQMTSSAGAASSAIKAAMTANGSGNNASQIIAIRVDGQAQVAGRYSSVNSQNGSNYTPTLDDENSLVLLSNVSDITVTLPQDSDLGFPLGGRIDFMQIGSGQVTFTQGTGATVNATPSKKTRTQWSSVTAIKIAADSWVVVGDLSSA